MLTEELIEIIVKRIGVKLPYYDYEYRKFIGEVPVNLNIGGTIRGVEQPDMFDTYNEACMYIYNWAVTNNCFFDEK